jgi:hypothetical protein
MSTLPTMKSTAARAAATSEMTNATQRRLIRQGSFVLVVATALAVAGCTGGAGLDIPIGPVNHSCPDGNSCGRHR